MKNQKGLSVLIVALGMMFSQKIQAEESINKDSFSIGAPAAELAVASRDTSHLAQDEAYNGKKYFQVHNTKYVFTNPAITLPKGYNVFHSFDILGLVGYSRGVTDHFEITGTAFLFGQGRGILNSNLRLVTEIAKNLHIGASLTLNLNYYLENSYSVDQNGNPIYDQPHHVTRLTYLPMGLITYGNFNSNITLGLGYWNGGIASYSDNNGHSIDNTSYGLVTIGGVVRVGGRISILAETFAALYNNSSKEYAGIKSLGVRFHSRAVRIDLGAQAGYTTSGSRTYNSDLIPFIGFGYAFRD